MFPSGGYFRSANCPFFLHDLCHRPYCHFRHAKPEYKPTTISTSSVTNEPAKSEKSEHKKDKLCTEHTKNKVKADKDVKHNLCEKQVSVAGPANPIFKRTALEEKLIAISANVDAETFSDSDSDCSETLQSNVRENIGNAKVVNESSKKDIPEKTPVSKVGSAIDVVRPVVARQVEPVAQDVKPVTRDIKPVVEEVKPIVEEVKPVVQEVKPVAQEVKPVAQEVIPVAQEVKPVAQEVKPVAQEVKPVAQEVKPVAQEVKPVSQEAKSVAQEAKSVVQEAKSVVQEVKPVAQDIKPVAKEVKPVAQEVKPVAQEAKSVVQEAKSVVQEAKSVVQEAKSVAQEAKPVVQDIKPVAQEVKSVVQEVSPIAEDIKTVAHELRPVVETTSNESVDHDDCKTGNNDDKIENKKTAIEHLPRDNITDPVSDNIVNAGNSDETADDTKSKNIAGRESLGVLIEDLQKYGKGVKNIERKKEEKRKDETDCRKELSESETSQLSDVNFFSSIVVKRSSGKKKKQVKVTSSPSGDKKVAKKSTTDDKSKISTEKIKNRKKTKLSEAKTSKDRSKIQRYKDLKKLIMGSSESLPSVGDSSKNCIAKESEKRGEKKETKSVLIDRDNDKIRVEEDIEEKELLRLFNDYNPSEEPDCMDVVESCRVKYKMENNQDDGDVSSTAHSESVKRPSTEKAAVVFKKQRVAHQPNHMIHRVVGPSRNSSSTFRRLPRPLVGTFAPQAKIQRTQGDKDLVTSTHVKQRVTHFAKSAGTTYIRPRIRLEYGAKVPQSVRQKYLDKLVDEYLCIYEDQQEAFDKAEKEEKAIFSKSPRRQVYINVCVNHIKKLRDGDEQSKEGEESKSGKRNPLAAKSSLPSPQKRLKLDTSLSILAAEYIPTQETIVNAVKKQRSVDDEMNENMFYTRLNRYLLSEEELVANGFPRASDIPGRAEINDPYGKVKRNFSDPTRHVCCRCGKPFVILESGEYRSKEECIYHYGRLLRRRTAGEIITSYTCCQGESGYMGCSVAKAHVRQIDWSEESGFMKTIPSPFGSSEKIFALDCEMCYTTKGLELTRVTVVDYKHQQIYDSLVKPDNLILDYNTRFSGITEESMMGIKTTLREVQAVLLSIIHADTILLGHSLESDLKSLKLIHSTIVDTSVVFPHRLGPPYKRALRTLMGEFVRKIIQDSEEGHDSLEDAASCVELMLYKVKEDLKVKEKSKKQ